MPETNDEQGPLEEKESTWYESAGAGLNAVREDYQYWTGKVSDTSPQLCYAIIAANWAVYGSLQKILGNGWSKASVFVAILSLGVNLVGSKHMGDLHFKQAAYAEEDLGRWEAEYKQAKTHNDTWPYTTDIENLGRFYRELRTWLPVVGGALFLVALGVS